MIRTAVALAAVIFAAGACNKSDESSPGEPALPPTATAHVTPSAPIDATPVATDKIALQVIGMT